ncbi:TPA: 50S ribosomal protein L23 [Legionella pneumophila subsp. pneumophila]|uniref:50S ribosomal protein L23 n=1 Tax=Legionella pneumophila TaxID=446 RepID=UPI0001E3C840|nr:50S ribosomal protein L23 [Legionella pneumophila]MDC8030931.1 50S ribosomal protein L23 [Legionella pneumophila subsp. pneumophila]MDW8870730.1 50S ribosomal protein L23 [Legionella pneumophila]MDW8901951.1 50S ribosomal protein L23 [Legionella pneumophila]MDW8907437.1 50S ribosomal protein L23 [Legionella pneumophila]MDW8916831.1 50S ribosomal protein L23 [Legionella pneumophila]
MNAERLMMVLREPHTSEKATVMADKFKQFTFKVLKNATKTEIKLAVEHIFNVKVKSVSVVNVKGKSKRFKQTSGKRSDWKKAFVSLHADQDIDFTATE